MFLSAVFVSLLIFLSLTANALDAEKSSDTISDIRNINAEKTTLKVALYPYLPDSAGDNFTNLTRFIQEEFNKVQPDINLQLRPLTQDEDYYSLPTLTKWLSTSGNGYDIVEIDTVILGDVINNGLIAPLFTIPSNHSDWHPSAASAVQFNQAIYAYPHLMCAYFLFTRDEQVAKATTIDQLINILGSNATPNYRLIGNLNSSWELPALWIKSYQNSNSMESNVEAFAIHSYQSDSFETMRKLAQLCERTGGENNCLNGVFRDNTTMTSLLFASKQSMAMFGYSERLFHILKNGNSDDYQNITMTPLPIGTTDNQHIYFTDAFVFRRNMSDNVLKAAHLFAEFMGTPRMQAAVVGSEDSLNGKLRYLLPISKNAYNEPILANDRFYQQYFRNLSVGYPVPTIGFANTRKDLQAAIMNYIDYKNPKPFSSITISLHSNPFLVMFFIFYLFH